VTSSVVRYGPAALEQAKTVAAAVPGAVLQASASIGSAVQLVLGPGFAKVVQVQVSPPSPSPSAAAPVTTAAARTAPVSAPVSCG
jgi:hypothetical protein